MSMISVQLYSVRDAFAAHPEGTLRQLAQIGFTRVEPYGVVENVAVLSAALPAFGLAAPTAHAKLLGADQLAVFRAAAELGIGTVIDPMVNADKWQDAADIEATAAGLNAAAAAAADHGVTVGYHNHWWELQSRIGGRHALEYLADHLDPAVVLEVDAYWATAGGADPAALLGRLGSRVRAVHVKDGDLALDGSGQVPAGGGQVPMATVLAAAPDALRVAEFDRYDGDVFDALAATYGYLIKEGVAP